jgi:hypothetical protein
VLGGFHKNKEAGKVYDARHVGVSKFDSALGAEFRRHGFSAKVPTDKNDQRMEKILEEDCHSGGIFFHFKHRACMKQYSSGMTFYDE